MTQEEFDFLKEFEGNFKTAINSNYSRNIVKGKLEKMHSIYKRVTGREYSLCTHCPNSILQFLKLIGGVYFKEVQVRNEPILKTNELQNVVTEKENNKMKNIKKKWQIHHRTKSTEGQG